MSKRIKNKNNHSFFQLVAGLSKQVLNFAVCFFRDVEKTGLWNRLFVYVAVFVITSCVSYEIFKTSHIIAISLMILQTIILLILWHINYIRTKNKLDENNRQKIKWWYTLDGWEFEEQIAEIFRKNGYDATVTKGSHDNGADIIVKKDCRSAIVQCKHYKNPVPPEPCRALWGCKEDFEADFAIMVASAGLTKGALKFAENKPEFKILNIDDIIRITQNNDFDKKKYFGF